MLVYFHGKPACPCLKKWLTAYQAALLRRGIIKKSIDVYQLIGGYVGSAGTHRPGGAYDIAQRSPEAILVAREMGAMAWDRPDDWDGDGGIGHQHGVLIGCPHNAGGRYQIDAGKAGYNGLGRGGRGGRDTGHRPKVWRTWQQGIEWEKEQAAAALAASTKPTKAPTKPKKPLPVPARLARFFHPKLYRLANSIRGLDAAVRRGYSAVDLDQQVSADGVMHCAHYDEVRKNGDFRWDSETGPRVARGEKISELSSAQIARLVSSSDGFRIQPTTRMLSEAKARRLRVELEAKASRKLERPQTWVPVLAHAREEGVRVQVKTLSNIGRPVLRLRAVKAAAEIVGIDVKTIALPRGTRRLRAAVWWPVTDLVRGPVWWI